jgi:hypothetical protein
MRIAEELRDAAKDTDRLHCLVDGVEWRSVKEKEELIRSAQLIDAIEQRLSGLSDFVSALADLAPDQWLLQGHVASQNVKLAALAARLAALPHSGSSHPAGESEFF